MRRWVFLGVAIFAGLAVVYLVLLRSSSVAPRLVAPSPTSVIGSGEDAVGVSAIGVILAWQPAPEEGSLPRLPLSELPENGRLAGPMLQQARVLGGAPPALRPYVASSYYGESGVDVELTSGIELRFGDASRIDEKWQAAATVLADPSITALDYVDLHAPRHPSIYGEGHTLPPVS
ncbi:MAG: cell division protein FtsQ/DivIB [Solirubrobacterales bacterium]